MIDLLDGSHGDIEIDVEYKLFLAHEYVSDFSPEELRDVFIDCGHPCYWCAQVQDRQYYCKQLIVLDYPFSEQVIDKITDLWHCYAVDHVDIERVHVVKTCSVYYYCHDTNH